MIKYTWDIVSLTKRDYPNLDLKDVVVSVQWKRIGTNEKGASYEYLCESPVPPPADATNFKDLDDVTEEEVVEWVVTNLDPNALSVMDELIAVKLAEASLSAEVVVPWVKKPKKAKKKGK
jgi:hypothetical protein